MMHFHFDINNPNLFYQDPNSQEVNKSTWWLFIH